MAEIVGTITNLSDFLSKTQVCLSVKPNDPQQQIICLEADRKYSIPAFQREVRWDDNNLKMLLYDLSRSSKFLGNIILTIKSDHTCEIIDGQQRTTVLMLIVSCIKKKFGTKISTPDLCPLRNEGFTGFQTLLEKAFDQEAITSDDWNAILKSDDYHQLPRIQKLWNTISSSELLADRHKAQGLLDNLCKSEFNIIASYSNDVNTSIQYFLDVNLKGIRLDTEDIFKGYLFSQDSRELTRSLWQKNKRDVLRLNGVTQSSEEKRYPLMKLYEHFFYCDLYLPREGDCEYSTLKFGENFCLTSGFESGSTKYYEDLCRDLGQIFLAEAGVPEVGVKACHRQDDPFAIILPVGEVIADQRTDNLGWNFLRKRCCYFLCQFKRQLRPLSAQRPQLQRIGKDIIKAQCPRALGLGRKNRDLILHHLASPCGGKLGLNDLRILE